MMKHEFEARIGTETTPEQWDQIEDVYTFSSLSWNDIIEAWKSEGPVRIEALAFKAGMEEKDRLAEEIHDLLKKSEAENAKLREMVAKLEAELREACVQLFRAQKGVQ